MIANLNRQKFIDLLNKLGDPNDDEVVAAARDLHAQVVVSGLTWDDLLFPEEEEEEKKEALSLINQISELGVSAETKKELEEYKIDIKEGEFEKMDLKYLQALHKRLAK